MYHLRGLVDHKHCFLVIEIELSLLSPAGLFVWGHHKKLPVALLPERWF
jgi:hypothetical protein